MHNSLIISNHSIRQDAEGRFCLNDLHKAAGNHVKHKPANWLKNQQTLELIAELSSDGIPSLEQNQPVKVINGGNNPGTYVIKELVYAYAMWISAKFHIQVIRAYDAMINGQIPENLIRAYEILVENLPYVKPITTAISLAEYEVRKSALQQGLQDLNNAKILMTGTELEAFRKLH
jgi:hypothetical protein